MGKGGVPGRPDRLRGGSGWVLLAAFVCTVAALLCLMRTDRAILIQADLLYEAGRPDLAMYCYYDYLAAAPDSPNRPRALLFYGHSLGDAGDSCGARQVYRMFLQEYPDRKEDCREVKSLLNPPRG